MKAKPATSSRSDGILETTRVPYTLLSTTIVIDERTVIPRNRDMCQMRGTLRSSNHVWMPSKPTDIPMHERTHGIEKFSIGDQMVNPFSKAAAAKNMAHAIEA